jgi:uncharacterized protein HemX
MASIQLAESTAGQNCIVGLSTARFDCCGYVTNKEKNMSPFLTKMVPLSVVLIGSLGLGGCATKGFVREQVATVNQRVDALDAKLQTTDQTAQQALAEAQSASGQAQQNSQRLDQLNGRVDGVEQQLQAAQRKRARN